MPARARGGTLRNPAFARIRSPTSPETTPRTRALDGPRVQFTPRSVRNYRSHWRRRYGRGLSRARYDARRDVAIKVLPASFSNDAMRVARFEQEAKTLASLNHSNIAHIYGLERSVGDTAIVMELVDGMTLMERIALGPLPVEEALRIRSEEHTSEL